MLLRGLYRPVTGCLAGSCNPRFIQAVAVVGGKPLHGLELFLAHEVLQALVPISFHDILRQITRTRWHVNRMNTDASCLKSGQQVSLTTVWLLIAVITEMSF